MVDRRTGSVLYAPRLGWRNVDLRDRLTLRIGCAVHIESAPIACAMARLWLSPDGTQSSRSFAYVSISDGVGVGLVVDGDVVRGQAHTAGEFGHISIDPSGPVCACGRRGCWEAFVCNGATVERYAERVVSQRIGAPVSHVRWNREPAPAVEEVIRRAQQGQTAAVETLHETGHHIGRGLAAVVSAFNPGRIYVGGEITAAWPILREPLFRRARRWNAHRRGAADARRARRYAGGIPATRRRRADRRAHLRRVGREDDAFCDALTTVV